MNDQTLRDFALRHQLSPQALGELYELMELSEGNAHASTLIFEANETLAVEATPSRSAPSVHLPDRRGERYTRLRVIGQGATSEVWRVRDHDLKREMAMKILDARYASAGPKALSRFLAEAQVTAQLQHPSILPVHEIGQLDDGTVYFTMEEVQGSTLEEVTHRVHRASQEVWSRTDDGWSLRRLVEAFRRVCEAVAYAHSRGVVHRDLKPANVMVGAFGQVKVMDWGLARVLEREDASGGVDDEADAVDTLRSDDALVTRAGTIAGTPAFMSPEQAAGDVDLVDERSDVWSLGALLYFLLADRAPFEGTAVRVIYRLVYGQADPLVGRPDGPLLPAPLVAIVERAMARDPSDRYPDALAMVTDVTAWLDGAERRAAALRAVGEAAEARRSAGRLRREARSLRAAVEAGLAALPIEASDDARAPWWGQEDEATELELRALAQEWTMEQELTAAFAHEPGLPEAHVALARETQRRHQEAEARGDAVRARRLELQLRHHVDALAPEWPGRARLVRYLEGTGRLTLELPPGVEAELAALAPQARRWLPTEGMRVPGGLVAHPVPEGSYVVTLRTAGGEHVYPVHVARTGHWQGAVSRVPSVPSGSVWVPAGPYLSGALRQPAWLDDLVVRTHPVTWAEWRQWLVERRDAGEPVSPEHAGAPEGRRAWADGLPPADLDTLPVTGVPFVAVQAYVAWRAERDGMPWQLPTVAMWEKASRGVDGRCYAVGPHLESHWVNLWRADGAARVEAVGDRPADVSVYGVRGTIGNVSEWTSTPCGDGHHMACGGSYLHEPAAATTTAWRPVPDDARWPHVGFRLVCLLPAG